MHIQREVRVDPAPSRKILLAPWCSPYVGLEFGTPGPSNLVLTGNLIGIHPTLGWLALCSHKTSLRSYPDPSTKMKFSLQLGQLPALLRVRAPGSSDAV